MEKNYYLKFTYSDGIRTNCFMGFMLSVDVEETSLMELCKGAIKSAGYSARAYDAVEVLAFNVI